MKARDALRENNVFRSEIRERENLKLSRTLKRKQRVPIPKNLLAPIEIYNNAKIVQLYRYEDSISEKDESS